MSICAKFKDEQGVTTVAMAIAIIVSVAMIFTGAQLYKVQSASAECQEVADVCALSSENEVAEFVALANACDATLLSMTLLAGTLYATGIVTACIPASQTLSANLLEQANSVSKSRDEMYEGMANCLNMLQRKLPLLAAAKAMATAKSNDDGALPANYNAISALLPAAGVEIATNRSDGISSFADEEGESIAEIQDRSAEAEDAAKRANEAKKRGFLEDCGYSPSYCMYERAASLSSIGKDHNPLFESVDAWSFQVAVDRARSYYAARAAAPIASNGSVESRADSALRKRFYEYASDELNRAFVKDDDQGFDCNIPHLFRNTEELRQTELYKERAYPITISGQRRCMHAWSGCPNAKGASELGSIEQLDSGGFELCNRCEFRTTSLGSVASASTSISNGFENHYEKMRQAAESYKNARSDLDPLLAEVKSKAQGLFDKLKDAIEDAVSKRIDPNPPGRYGCVCLLVNSASNPSDTGFETTFVLGEHDLGVRVAISAACLEEDDSENGSAVITRLLEGLVPKGSFFDPASQVASGLWESLLFAYEDGQRALTDGLKGALDSMHLVSASGLGTWAKGAIEDSIEALGLQPADIRTKMPIILNSSDVASKDSGQFAVRILQAKDIARQGSSPSPGTFASLANAVEGIARERIESGKAKIAQIELPFAGGTQTIEWLIPSFVTEHADNLVDSIIGKVTESISSLDQVRGWQ